MKNTGAGDPAWSRKRLDRVVGGGREQSVQLPSAIPVHLLYFTASADEHGMVHFRDDLYHRDDRLDRALQVSAGGNRP